MNIARIPCYTGAGEGKSRGEKRGFPIYVQQMEAAPLWRDYDGLRLLQDGYEWREAVAPPDEATIEHVNTRGERTIPDLDPRQAPEWIPEYVRGMSAYGLVREYPGMTSAGYV